MCDIHFVDNNISFTLHDDLVVRGLAMCRDGVSIEATPSHRTLFEGEIINGLPLISHDLRVMLYLHINVFILGRKLICY